MMCFEQGALKLLFIFTIKSTHAILCDTNTRYSNSSATCTCPVFENGLFFKIHCKESMYSMSKAIYKIVPLTNLNKYLHNDTSETEVNVNIRVNKGSEKL